MERKELLEWAIKGLYAEIALTEKRIKKCKEHLELYRYGGKGGTKITGKKPDEIKKQLKSCKN